jgi:hypothetical protein
MKRNNYKKKKQINNKNNLNAGNKMFPFYCKKKPLKNPPFRWYDIDQLKTKRQFLYVIFDKR